MPRFICDYLNEMVLLSDGRVTTCCLDPLAVNAFSSIYEHDFSHIRQNYLELREQITRDVLSMPRCAICYTKLQQAGFPHTGTYRADPAPHEIDLFLNKPLKQCVIELTSQCNLKCSGCMQSRYDFRKYRAKPYLDVKYLQSWLDPGLVHINRIRLYNYGETFLHPAAIAFCRFVKNQAPDLFLEIATNGVLLDTPEKRAMLMRAGIDYLVFSIHGSSQETVQKYMTPKFKFQRLLDILRDLVTIRSVSALKKPLLIWKYLLFEWNDSDAEIDRARRLSKEIGLDGLQFCLVGYPSPSKRFTPNSPEWKKLQETN
jgi:hypothetical protein